jgi:hypothetical protein
LFLFSLFFSCLCDVEFLAPLTSLQK